MLIILGTQEPATSQYWGSGLPIRCCTYNPLGEGDYQVSVSVCWLAASYSNNGCPCTEQAWGEITINGAVYPLLYIDCNDVNAYCCVLG